jgi:hypothetical protein
MLSISRYRLEFDLSFCSSRLGTSDISGLMRLPIEVLTPLDMVAAIDFLADEDIDPVAERCNPLGDDRDGSSSREEVEAPRSRWRDTEDAVEAPVFDRSLVLIWSLV